jgi:anaerobic magnesium-protoporphyrin IX monomethyl ester cyclase
MKVRLIEPEPPGMNVYSMILLPRLGLPLIGATLTAAGHDVLIYNSNIAPIDWDDVLSADLVGISTTTSTVPSGYEFADRVRERGIPVIMGGSHVTFMAAEALEHADYVARGEGGEQLMLELIDALAGKRELDSIAGLSFRRDGVVVDNARRDACSNLDELPFPDLTLIRGHEELKTTPMMTSWGCPFKCNFCSVTAMFGRKYRFRSTDNVIAEIKEKRPSKIFFYDDNLAADKKRLKVLLQRMIDEDLVIPWSGQVRTDVARDPELLDLMHRTGCFRVYLGLESVNQATLDAFDKSQTVDDIVKSIATLHTYGIETHGMFVLGADTDDQAVVRDTVKFAMKNHIDTVQLNIMTPLPGTPLFHELTESGRIFDHEWEHYDAHHVVFQPAKMTPYELQVEVLHGFMRFYSLRQWLKYFLTFRFTKLLFQSWGWWIIRTWRKDERNIAFLQWLKKVHLPRLPQSVRVADPER